MKSCTLKIAILVLSLATGGAYAQQAYPTKPIRLIVPFPPAGQTDVVARVIAQKLSEAFGQQVVVDNRPGAGGNIGVETGVRAPADGYTMLQISTSYAANVALHKLPYDPINDVVPVIMIGEIANMVTVHPSGPFKSVKELIGYARANPGKINFASGGTGSGNHLATEEFAQMTGVRMTHVPYKGGGPAIADLVGGNVAMSFASMTSSLAFIKAGRLRPLAVSSKERSRLLPDVPTMSEAGGPNIIVPDWQGILAPRGTPKAVVDRLYTEVARILRQPDVQERFSILGMDVIASGPAEFRKAISSEIARWAKVVKDANIKVD